MTAVIFVSCCGHGAACDYLDPGKTRVEAWLLWRIMLGVKFCEYRGAGADMSGCVGCGNSQGNVRR